MLRRLMLAAVLVAAGLAAGCGNDNSTPAPTTETPTAISETFTGSLSVNGAFTHPFIVSRAGSVTAQITALAPDDTVSLGLALGTWNGVSCQIVITSDTARLSSTVLGTATSSGALCVRVFDVGGLTATTTYDVKVDHY